MDARYCSAACRNAAQRQRKREDKLRQRASAAQQAASESAAAAESRRLQHLRELFIEQMQGKRFAAKCPALQIDPWLQGHATVHACNTLIEHLGKLRERVREDTARHLKPQLHIGLHLCAPTEVPLLERRVTHVGVSVLPDFADGHVVMLYVQRPESAKDRPVPGTEAPAAESAASGSAGRSVFAKASLPDISVALNKFSAALGSLVPSMSTDSATPATPPKKEK